MKTTIELPDMLLRRVKATAAAEGRSMREFVTEALEDKLARETGSRIADKPWMALLGAGREYSAEIEAIDVAIEEAFEQIDEEDWK